jgi:uncharacterized protein (TIRG00374 family)
VKKSLTFAVGIAISAVCLWYSMREVKLHEVVAALRQSDFRGFIALMLVTLAGFWLRAFRWRWLLTTPKPLPVRSLFSATMIGFMANNLLPLRLGEFVRAWALGRREGLSKTTVFATIIVERVIDMLTLLAIFGVALLMHPIRSDTVAGRLTNAGAALMLLMSVALTIVLVVVERKPAMFEAFLARVARRAPGFGEKAAVMLHQFVIGLSLFRDLPRLVWVFVLSFAMFAAFALCLTISMWSVGISVPWYGGLTMLVITAIGIMIPAAPGYIGTLHIACEAGLALFAVSRKLAAPFSWFFWAGQWIPVTLVGFAFLHAEGLSLGAITHAQDEVKD